MEVPAPQAQIRPAPGSALLDRGETETFHDFFNRFDLPNFDGDLDFAAPFGSVDTDAGSWHDWNPLTLPVFQGSSTSLHPPTFASTDNFYNLEIGSSPLGSSTRKQASLQQRRWHNPPGISANGSHSRQQSIALNPLDIFPAQHRQQASEAYAERESLAAFNHPISTGLPTHRHSISAPGLAGSGRNEHNYVEEDMSPFPHFASPQKATLSGLETRIPQFGSDANFQRKGYQPPPDQRKPDEMPGLILTALERQSSAANTQPSSPVLYKRKRPLANLAEQPEATPDPSWANAVSQASDEIKIQSAREPMAHKRQKSSVQEGGIGLDHQLEASAGKRKIRAKPAGKENGTKARRSSSKSEQKPPRQNLTEDQKRENHILSEQKRRDLIKQGFDQLFDLLPATKAAGSSRSQQLCVAADWLEEVVAGNERLRRQLVALDGR